MNFDQPVNLVNKKEEKQNNPESKTKKGLDFVFEKNTELTLIGTKEQYSEYLDTIFPKSIMKDIVYHGTNVTFDEFKQRGILKGSYFTDDLSNAEMTTMVNRGFKKYNPIIMPAILDFRNPYFHKGR